MLTTSTTPGTFTKAAEMPLSQPVQVIPLIEIVRISLPSTPAVWAHAAFSAAPQTEVPAKGHVPVFEPDAELTLAGVFVLAFSAVLAFSPDAKATAEIANKAATTNTIVFVTLFTRSLLEDHKFS
jgi:hypothetical protein